VGINMKKYFIIFLATVLSMSVAFADNSDLAVTITSKAESVLEKKRDAINLEELRGLVVNENIDIQLSYERLFQAQKKIGSARAEYFPYGVGAVASIYFYGAFSYLFIAELVTSLPSKIYNVQKRKNIRNAQREYLKAVEANIHNEVAKMYYGFLKDEALLKIATFELKLLEAKIASVEERIEFGISTDTELESAKYHYYTLRDVFLRFNSYYLQSLQALNVLMGRPSSMPVIALQPVAKFLSADLVRMSTEKMKNIAIKNSNELKAANYLIRAAHNNTNSVAWSVLSFSGIGFGYMNKIRSSKSETKEAYFVRDSAKRSVESEVYTRKAKLVNSIGILDQDRALYQTTKFYVEGEIADFKAGQLTLPRLIETELIYLTDYREAVRSHYNTLSNLDNLKRVVGAKVYDTITREELVVSTSSDEVELSVSRTGKTISIKTYSVLEQSEIARVTYDFDGKLFNTMTSISSINNFTIKLFTKRKTTSVSGQATITMRNGDVITKTIEI